MQVSSGIIRSIRELFQFAWTLQFLEGPLRALDFCDLDPRALPWAIARWRRWR
jgi:hypothetical protein